MPSLLTLDREYRRTYVIGDVHGCLKEMIVLLDYLERTAGLEERDLLVFLGDYIDRGPESKTVIEYLLDFRKRYPQTVFLKGNHEDMLLSFLGFPGRMGNAYLGNGGVETLDTYQVRDPKSVEEIKACFPESHLQFFTTLTDYAISGEHIFVHAGLSPLKPLNEQREEDLFWIRDEFIMNIHRFEKTIIFGHTPYHDLMFHLPYKIGIDTGLVYGNQLSCIELAHRHVFQVKAGERTVRVSTLEEKVPPVPGKKSKLRRRKS